MNIISSSIRRCTTVAVVENARISPEKEYFHCAGSWGDLDVISHPPWMRHVAHGSSRFSVELFSLLSTKLTDVLYLEIQLLKINSATAKSR